MPFARIRAWDRSRRGQSSTPSSTSPTRPTNLITPLRLGLALMVVLSHAFSLSGNPEPLGAITHNRLTLGLVAVLAFFALSGMLITASGERLGRRRFVWHRFLRLYPAFWVCLAITGFAVAALGPATLREAVEYFRANGSIVLRQYSVSGEPFNTPIPHAVNQSMWTLGSEAGCYIVVMLFARRRWWAPAMFVGVLGLGLLFPVAPGIRFVLPLWMAFAAGAFIYKFRVPTGPVLMTGAAVFLAVAIVTHRPNYVAIPAIAILAIGLGRLQGRWRLPDLSYGTYLYAFPVMQGLVILGMRDPLPLFLVTIAVVLPIAVASWYIIEKPALALKSWRGVAVRRYVHASDGVAAAE
jgi:peptidoglycan/LPS O-acetylase OafA/YrhL